jgi:hypothetical protein
LIGGHAGRDVAWWRRLSLLRSWRLTIVMVSYLIVAVEGLIVVVGGVLIAAVAVEAVCLIVKVGPFIVVACKETALCISGVRIVLAAVWVIALIGVPVAIAAVVVPTPRIVAGVAIPAYVLGACMNLDFNGGVRRALQGPLGHPPLLVCGCGKLTLAGQYGTGVGVPVGNADGL